MHRIAALVVIDLHSPDTTLSACVASTVLGLEQCTGEVYVNTRTQEAYLSFGGTDMAAILYGPLFKGTDKGQESTQLDFLDDICNLENSVSSDIALSKF